MEEDKDIEKFTKDILNEIGLEQPSASFVDDVMVAVEQPVVVNTVYKPLISKKVWGLITACFVGLLVWMFTLPIETSLLDKLEISVNTDINFNFLKGVSFSSPVVYALSVFGLLVLIQIYLLKHNFDKQMEAV